MGGSFSSPNGLETLQNYGSMALLHTLAEADRITDLTLLEDATIMTVEPLTSLNPQEVYQETSLLCSRVVTSNESSKNICELVHFTIDMLNELADATKLPTGPKIAAAANCTFTTRLLLASMIETYPGSVGAHLTFVPSPDPEAVAATEPSAPVNLCHPLLCAVVGFIMDTAKKVDADNVYLYKEVLKLLITLMSTQLASNPTETLLLHRHTFLELLVSSPETQQATYGYSFDANRLMSILLEHVIARKQFAKPTTKTAASSASTSPGDATQPPSDIEGNAGRTAGVIEDDDTAWGAFVELGRFFAFPFVEISRLLTSNESGAPAEPAPLGDLSIFAVLLLANFESVHCPASSNPYRSYLSNLSHQPQSPSLMVESSASPSAPVASSDSNINFTKLYQTLVARNSEDSTLVLLYMLLQNNQSFHSFLASRADLDALLLPLLSALYRAHEHTRVRVYTTLIIMSILTFDEHFIQSIQGVVIATPSWFKEKYLRAVSLPEFVILVLMRTIQLNLKGIRDAYLHDNCLASMCNLATQLNGLSLYTSKKLIQVANLYIQRYQSLMHRSTVPATSEIPPIKLPPLPRDNGQSGSDEGSYEQQEEGDEYGEEGIRAEERIDMLSASESQRSPIELLQTLDATEGYIRTIIEIIDCLFRKKASNNVQLLYALILETNLFESIANHPRLADIVVQIRAPVEHFLREVQAAECNTPTQVVQQLTTSALKWTSDIPIPDLRFAYQETNAAIFFTPSIWKLTLKHPQIYWNPESIQLFDTGSDPSFAGDDDPEDPPREDLSEAV